eukprot:32994_1
MGATDSKQKLGERVLAARKKLEEDRKIQCERYKHLQSKSPETMKFAIESISKSFQSCSPFLDPVLLLAWQYDHDQCKTIILTSCKKVLSAPIIHAEYQWFKQYVFTSSVWLFKTTQNRFMYEELMDTTDSMSKDIISTMDSIYNHLQSHPKWYTVMGIANKTIVSRQDHSKVGLLHEKGIRDIVEVKEKDAISDEIETFIDSNLATNVLTTTANNINDEFQTHIDKVMSHFGDFKAGPMKKVERCLSKIENDYQDAAYPKAARLLDLVRCSVTFNTVEQLIAGYKGLMHHMNSSSSSMELARIKNGFLDANYDGGYRDIKINVVYHSSIHKELSMVCEVQLLLGQYLYEKKRIHKLYNIVRQQLYFKMVVEADEEKVKQSNDPSELKFVPVFDIRELQNVKLQGTEINKCSTDSSLGLLGVEAGPNRFLCIDIHRKEEIFNIDLEISDYIGRHSHHWITIDQQKYLSIQTAKNIIKMYQIKQGTAHRFSFEEDEQFRVCLPKSDTINCCEFDRNFKNIIILKNGGILEKRSIRNVNKKKRTIKLEERVQQNDTKMLSLSNNGKWCVIGTGQIFFFVIDIQNKQQYKVRWDFNQSNELPENYILRTKVPCFINGEAKCVAVGGHNSLVAIWDIQEKDKLNEPFIYSDTNRCAKILNLRGQNVAIDCTYSTNNILAVGSQDKMLRLWNVNKWEMFYSKKLNMVPNSLHLTEDSRYLTIGGYTNRGQCIVLEIK